MSKLIRTSETEVNFPNVVDKELLETILGKKLPKGVLGIYPRAYVDWEDDEVIKIHVVYDDKVDLDSHTGVPDVDYNMIRSYFKENYPGRARLIRSVNIKEIKTILQHG